MLTLLTPTKREDTGDGGATMGSIWNRALRGTSRVQLHPASQMGWYGRKRYRLSTNHVPLISPAFHYFVGRLAVGFPSMTEFWIELWEDFPLHRST